MNISIDLGDTLFNRRSRRIKIRHRNVRPLFPGALPVLRKILRRGHTLHVISKIDRGDELRVMRNLAAHRLTPNIIKTENVMFCFTRAAKGPIAKCLGIDIHIDDRIEVIRAVMRSGIRRAVLFTGAYDESEGKRLSKKVRKAEDWKEVFSLLEAMPGF
jgi:hypothetical protein